MHHPPGGSGRRGCGLVLLVALTMFRPAAALAQVTIDTPMTAPPPKGPIGQMQFGRFVVTPTLAFGNIGIDTNVTNDQGDPRRDFTFAVGPFLRFEYRGPRLTFDTRAGALYTYYATFKNEGGLSPSVDLVADYKIGPRINLFTRDTFWFIKDRPSVEIDARARRGTSDTAVGVSVGLSYKLALEVRARERREQYASATFYRGVDLKEQLDQRVRELSTSLGFKLTPYTTLQVGESFTWYRYPYGVERNGDGRQTFVGMQFDPRALVSGAARVGVSTFRSTLGTIGDYRGLLLNGRLVYRITNTTGLSAMMDRDMRASYLEEAPYYQNSNYDLALQQRLTRWLDGGLGGTYYRNDYRGFATVSGIGAPLVTIKPEVITTYGVSLGVTPRRLGRYAVYLTEWERRSPDPRNNYKGLRFGFLISPGRWLTVTNDVVSSPWVNAQNGRALYTPPGF